MHGASLRATLAEPHENTILATLKGDSFRRIKVKWPLLGSRPQTKQVILCQGITSFAVIVIRVLPRSLLIKSYKIMGLEDVGSISV